MRKKDKAGDSRGEGESERGVERERRQGNIVPIKDLKIILSGAQLNVHCLSLNRQNVGYRITSDSVLIGPWCLMTPFPPHKPLVCFMQMT